MTEQQNEIASAPDSPFGQICWQIFEKFSKMELEMADLKKNGNKMEKLEKENERLKSEKSKLLAENLKLWSENRENEQLKMEKAKLLAENRELRGKVDKNALEKMSECIAGINIAIKYKQSQHLTPNNKWNLEEDEQYQNLTILDVSDEDGLVLEKTGGSNFAWEGRVHSACAETPVPDLNRNATKPYIAYYFESKFIHVTDMRKIQIGFCDNQFPFKCIYVGNHCSSIGINNKYGMRIDGKFQHFGTRKFNAQIGDDFIGKVVGIGLIHSPADSSLKAFASCEGEFLGSIELPAYFCDLDLYPVVSLFYKNDKIEANFGKTEWAFNPYQLVQ